MASILSEPPCSAHARVRNIAMLSEIDPQPEGRGHDGRGHTHTRSAPFHHGSVASCKRKGIPLYFLIAPFVTSLRPRNLTNDRMIDRCSGSALPNNASSSVHSVSSHLTQRARILSPPSRLGRSSFFPPFLGKLIMRSGYGNNGGHSF